MEYISAIVEDAFPEVEIVNIDEIIKLGPKKRGLKLRAQREHAGVNMRDLAKVCGIDFSLISRYESGDRPLSQETYLQFLEGIEKIIEQRREQESAMELSQKLLEANKTPMGKALCLRAFESVNGGQPLTDDEWRGVHEAILTFSKLKEQVKKLSTLPPDWLDHPVIKELIELYQGEIARLEQQVEKPVAASEEKDSGD
jgi:transcriptional regulator with XRE-family HTH domain